MPKLTENDIKNQIKNSAFLPVYFLYGDEGYLVSRYTSLICDSAVDEGFKDFNLTKFTENPPLGEVLNAALVLPMMAQYRAVVVVDYDAKLTEKDAAEFEEYLKNPSESTVLIFCFLGVSGGKQRKLSALCEKYGGSAKFTHKTEEELVRMICGGIGKRGCRISSPCARLLLERCGSDLNILRNEMDKLCCWKPGLEITDADIRLVCARTLNAGTFDMVKALTRGNLKAALKILNELYDMKEKPIMIFGGLCSSYVNMYRAAAAKNARIDPVVFGKSLGLKNANSLKYSLPDASRLGDDRLGESLRILDEYDKKLKSTSTDQKILVEEAVIRLAKLKGAAR